MYRFAEDVELSLKLKSRKFEESYESDSEEEDSLRKAVSVEEIRRIARRKQLSIIERQSEEYKDRLIGHHAHHLVEFSSLSPTEERLQVKNAVDGAIRPLLRYRQQVRGKAKEQYIRTVKRARQKILQTRSQEIQDEWQRQLEEAHEKKKQELIRARDEVELDSHEIGELLNFTLVNYETDIGIADAEMEELRERIQVEVNRIAQAKDQFEIDRDEIIRERNEMQNQHDELEEKVNEIRREMTDMRSEIDSFSEDEIRIQTTEKEKEIERTKREMSQFIEDIEELELDIKNNVTESLKSKKSEQEDAQSRLEKELSLLQEADATYNKMIKKEKNRDEIILSMEKKEEEVSLAIVDARKGHAEELHRLHIMMNEKFAEHLVIEDMVSMIKSEKSILEGNDRARARYIESVLKRDLKQIKNICKSVEEEERQFIRMLTFLYTLQSFQHEFMEVINIATKHMAELEISNQRYHTKEKDLVSQLAKCRDLGPTVTLKLEEVIEDMGESLFELDERKMATLLNKTLGLYATRNDANVLEQIRHEIRRELRQRSFKEQRLLGLARFLESNVLQHDSLVHLQQQALKKIQEEENGLIPLNEPPAMVVWLRGQTKINANPLRSLHEKAVRSVNKKSILAGLIPTSIPRNKELSVVHKLFVEKFEKPLERFSFANLAQSDMRLAVQMERVRREEQERQKKHDRLVQIQSDNASRENMSSLQKRAAINLISADCTISRPWSLLDGKMSFSPAQLIKERMDCNEA